MLLTALDSADSLTLRTAAGGSFLVGVCEMEVGCVCVVIALAAPVLLPVRC